MTSVFSEHTPDGPYAIATSSGEVRITPRLEADDTAAQAPPAITIRDDFRRHIPPLSDVERNQLKANLIDSGGPREPLVVWNTGADLILLDGHNRYDICIALDLPYGVRVLNRGDIADDEAALDWIDRNQLGRRNLSPDDFRIISGRIYNRRKRTKAEAGAIGGSKDQFDTCLSTAEEVSTELSVSAPTIKRNAQRAKLHDALLDAGETEAAEIAKSATQADIISAKGKPPAEAATELRAKKTVHVSRNSGCVEWFTPPEFIAAARNVMGRIDLDPASSEIAQQTVKASEFFTINNDGLSQDWFGRVWMNPPYTAGLVDKFISKLCEHHADEHVREAIVLVNNATDTKWFQQAAKHASAICIPQGRIRFLDPSGEPKGAPLQGQACIYFGNDTAKFIERFSQFGFCSEVCDQ